jgi:hypothetical protein
MVKKLYYWIAWHLPMKIVQEAFVRAAAKASCEELSSVEMDKITVIDVIRTWK